MSVLVPSVVGELVPVSALHGARPYFGRDEATQAQQLATLAGYRALRCQVKVWEMSQLVDDGIGTGMRSTWHLPFELSGFGGRLWVGFWCYAEENTYDPLVRIHVETLAGAIIDNGFDMSAANGYLPTAQPLLGLFANDNAFGGLQTLGVVADRDSFASTPFDEVDGRPNIPRLLDTRGREGELVNVRFTTTGCRLFSATVLEAYRPRLG